ncbi:hypothetical protein SEA_GAIL_65 [Mycobacterium phage Gail]|uniref:Uncharacterized protein n=2 Tax=Luchadorvirus TaxID=2948807 RepID=A0A7D5FP16_9CAUD|nr:hypothetical protein KNU75_gp042 [Mycobacterium phage Jeeves]YP_010109417.1 hypothetical protein KNV16_gp044 [Mycobacterium phage Gail]QFG04542.1 hypothetical protein SEA_JEEVES_67 [Mycobacterium phage Jeeves]QLF84629.1 hypothetical protein SEA_GAIL_65 [Mycobacterium phage Gail]
MKVSFKLLGFEIASVDLDLGAPGDNPVSADEAIRAASKPVKFMSKLWVRGMTA